MLHKSPAVPGRTSADGALSQDQELTQYIHSFTISSDRVRHIVVVAVVASVMAFAAQWNSMEPNWWKERLEEARVAVRNELWRDPELRLQACFTRGVRVADFHDPCERIAKTMAWLRRSTHGEDSLKAHLAELEKTRVTELLMISVPFLGIRFDINDLAAFSAIGLGIVCLMLCFAMARQYENLFLSLWKVRRLADWEDRLDDGESKANFLYHALAMAQVFTRPPTLARERPRGHGRVAVVALFFVPLLVQLFILFDSVRSIPRALMLNFSSTAVSLVLQALLFVVILLSTIFCWLYSRAGDARWKDTFFAINPGLRGVRGSLLVDWLRIVEPPRWLFAADWQGNVYFGDPVDSFGRLDSAWAVWRIPTDGSRVKKIAKPSEMPAEVAAPRGTCLAPSGSKYVFQRSEDDRAATVLCLTAPGGTTSRLAGGGRQIADGRGADAGFSRRIGAVALSENQDLYVVDGPCVRRIDAAGSVSTLGGNPLGGFRRSQRPRLLGLAIERDHLFVADYDYGCVRSVSAAGSDFEIPVKGAWCWSPAGVVVTGDGLCVMEHRRLSLLGTLLGKVAPLARIRQLKRNAAGNFVTESVLWRSPRRRAILSRQWWQALWLAPTRSSLPPI